MKINTIENGKVVIREMTEEELAAVPKYEATEPTQLDRIEAQTMYTALMTDTLLEE